MTTVEVIVGRGGKEDRHRKASREWVTARYTAHGYPVTVGVCRGAWRKAAAYNPPAAASTADVLIVADGDCVVTCDALTRAVEQAARAGYAAPAKVVRRLTPAATTDALACDPAADLDPRLETEGRHDLLAAGGILVIRRDVWTEAGGFDPRFIGWGGEDYALGCALYALTGDYARHEPGTMWHLWHPPQTRDQRLTPDNDALARRYLSAKHDPQAMRALLAEVPGDNAT